MFIDFLIRGNDSLLFSIAPTHALIEFGIQVQKKVFYWIKEEVQCNFDPREW